MKRKEQEREVPEIGDIVLVDGCHENYRPTLVDIEGENGVVILPGLGDVRTLWPMDRLRIAPPPKKSKRRGYEE